MNAVLRFMREVAVMAATVLICVVVIQIVKNIIVYGVCKEPQAQELTK